MLRIHLPAALLVFALVPLAQEVRVDPEAIDALFAEWDRTDSPGCALGVIHRGELVYARGYGMANLDHGVANAPDTVFRIGSTSKQVTAACVGLLVLDGRVDLDAEVREYVPELFDYGVSITVRHLLHHTSGLRDYLVVMSLAGKRSNDWYSTEEALEAIYRQRELNFAPGSQELYCNSGYLLLGEIVRRVSGQSLRAFAAERVFGPLGMTHTHFHDDHNEVVARRATGYSPDGEGGFRIDVTTLDMVGDGGVFTSVEDWAHWDRNASSHAVGGEALHALTRESFTLDDGRELDYRHGLVLSEWRGLPLESHGGAFVGYRADALRFPEQEFSVVCFANLGSFDPSGQCRKVAALCLAEFVEEEPARAGARDRGAREAPEPPGPMAPERRDALLGSYTSRELLDVVYGLRLEGERLVLTVGAHGDVDAVAHEDGVVRVPSWGLELHFGADAAQGFELAAGRVRGMRFERLD